MERQRRRIPDPNLNPNPNPNPNPNSKTTNQRIYYPKSNQDKISTKSTTNQNFNFDFDFIKNYQFSFIDVFLIASLIILVISYFLRYFFDVDTIFLKKYSKMKINSKENEGNEEKMRSLLEKYRKDVIQEKNKKGEKRFNVVITGGSRGIGLALAREFLSYGDRVCICGVSESHLNDSINRLKNCCEELYGFESSTDKRIFGTVCDISDPKQIQDLILFAQKNFPNNSIDIWINNAGVNEGMKGKLSEFPDENIKKVIDINLYGTILCTKYAINAMEKQKNGGRIFIMEGSGSFQNATENYSIYGATKASYRQFSKTMSIELKNSKVKVHRLSPGIVVTDLIKSYSDPKTLKIFNILAEAPFSVASKVVPKIRKCSGSNKLVSFLTPTKIAFRFLTAFFRKNRFWDSNGNLTFVDPYDALKY